MRPLPPLSGAVLAGGRSRRMGTAKAGLRLGGELLVSRLLRELAVVCGSVYLSLRADQAAGTAPWIPADIPLLVDRHEECGPIAALAAAHRVNPAAAWLLVACDMPGADRVAMAALAAGRDAECDVIAFSSERGAEPLFAVWEPAALLAASAACEAGRFRLRDVLRQCRTRTVAPPEPTSAENLNTPDQLEHYLARQGGMA